MTPLQIEQLRYAILQLLVNRFLAALADQEVNRGRRPEMTEFLQRQIEEFSKLVADDIQRNRAAPWLSVPLPPSVDTQTLKAEIDAAAVGLSDQIEVILRERDDWKPV